MANGKVKYWQYVLQFTKIITLKTQKKELKYRAVGPDYRIMIYFSHIKKIR